MALFVALYMNDVLRRDYWLGLGLSVSSMAFEWLHGCRAWRYFTDGVIVR